MSHPSEANSSSVLIPLLSPDGLGEDPSSSLGDLGTGKSVASVHLSSVVRLRFGLAGGAFPALGISTGSEVGSLAAALVLSAGLVDLALGFLEVAVAVLREGLLGSSLDSFLVAARVFPAGLSDISSSLITESALAVALVDPFFVSFLIAVGVLPTASFGGGFLATAPDSFPAGVDFFGAGFLIAEVLSPLSFRAGFFLGAIAVSGLSVAEAENLQDRVSYRGKFVLTRIQRYWLAVAAALGPFMISNVVIVLYSIAANRGAVVADAEDKEMRTANRHMGKENAAQRSLGRSKSTAVERRDA